MDVSKQERHSFAATSVGLSQDGGLFEGKVAFDEVSELACFITGVLMGWSWLVDWL